MKYRVAEKPCETCGDTLVVKQLNVCRKCCYGYKRHQYSVARANTMLLKRYGKTAAQVAKDIGCSVNRLLDRLDRMAVSKAILPPERFVAWEKCAIVKSFDSRGGIEVVAKRLGISPNALYQRVRRGESVQSASTRKKSQPLSLHGCKSLQHALEIVQYMKDQPANDNHKDDLQTVVDILLKITRRRKKAA